MTHEIFNFYEDFIENFVVFLERSNLKLKRKH